MNQISLTINNIEINVPEGMTVLDAAASVGIYIPVLCSHPDLGHFNTVELSPFIYQGENKIENDAGATIDSIRGCGVCLVMDEDKSEMLPSCKIPVRQGMKIITENESIITRRRENLSKILATHPHSCLTCAQREGCIPMTDVCPGNVVFNERCCALLNNCEIQRVSDYVGIAPETPRYQFRNLPRITEDPLFNRDYNLCIGCGRCVRVCQQVKGVYALGAVINNGKLVVGTVDGSLLDNAACRFCGSCVEVCPTGAIMDKVSPRLKEYKDFVPCKASCPGEVDIPQYVRLVREGKPQDAADVISASLPLPSVLGKVCFHPCETACKKNDLLSVPNTNKNAMSIRLIKDYAMTNSVLKPPKKLKENTGKNVTVIGAGPAGLSAAHFLSLKGHNVILYEKESEIGGMLRYGIPRYRLSEDVLNRDTNWILSSGINVKTNTIFGKDITLDALLGNGTDSVFISVGLSKSRRLPIQISDDVSVNYGVEFLNSLAKKSLPDDYFEGKSVVVIGGGNVATDAARCAVRLKAKDVTIVCLEQFNEMPAYEDEIREAQEEGIKILNGWGISTICNTENKTGIILKKCTRVFDEKLEFSPVYDESITDKLITDSVIICVGQEADISDETELSKLLNKGLIKANSDSLETGIKGVYAGGDIVYGPKSVIEAVGAGRKAARSIDLYLGGDGIIETEDGLNKEYNMFIGRNDGFNTLQRTEAKVNVSEYRIQNFEPYERTYTSVEALVESTRCLQCDLRLHLGHNPMPPEKYLTFNKEIIDGLPEAEGVIQILNNDKEVDIIKGTDNIRKTMLEWVKEKKDYPYFIYELDPMFTKRESELLQQYLQKHGKMPDAGDELDDLF
ncbi:MAG: 4Fe-4S dicluster domain-containing protein [Bacteroidetes bacterium]|nr:MAG: 4Fe-4S dicluster domain-containing protein [Bacteroidota bacterium]